MSHLGECRDMASYWVMWKECCVAPTMRMHYVLLNCRYEAEQERLRLEREEEERRRERWKAKGLPQTEEDPGMCVGGGCADQQLGRKRTASGCLMRTFLLHSCCLSHGVPKAGTTVTTGWAADDEPVVVDEAQPSTAASPTDDTAATERDEHDAAQLLKVALRLGQPENNGSTVEPTVDAPAPLEPLAPVPLTAELDSDGASEVEPIDLLTTPLDGCEPRDSDSCEGPRNTLYVQ